MSREIESSVFFDVSVENNGQSEALGKIIIHLYKATPKTSKNFASIAEGFKTDSPVETANGPTNLLHYKNSIFHRVIPNFMLQGGDIIRFNGTGSISIYGNRFPDENFDYKHDRPFLLTMANAGPNTNGSQFFITTVKAPWLNDRHVVFGEVDARSHAVVKAVEALGTGHGATNGKIIITESAKWVEPLQ